MIKRTRRKPKRVQRAILELPTNSPYHRTYQGKDILIKDMSDRHLMNTIALFEARGEWTDISEYTKEAKSRKLGTVSTREAELDLALRMIVTVLEGKSQGSARKRRLKHALTSAHFMLGREFARE